MKRRSMTRFLSLALAMGSICSPAWLANHAIAQTYPSGPVKLVLGTAAGGGTDVVARALAQKLSVALGQPFIVENRSGAGQTIGAAYVARAPADGQTLFFATQTLAANPYIYPNLPYDTTKDFVPVAFIARLPYAIFINGALPAKSLQEFIALARSKPGQLNFASAGASSLPRIAGETFQQRTGTKLVHVPYSGTAPAIMSLISGETQMWIGSFLTMDPYLQNGKLRALAVASEERYPNAPQVPTAAEAGLPGLSLAAWYGVMARSGTPAAVVERLNKEFNKALADPDIRELLVRDGAEPGKGQSPEEFGGFIARQMGEFKEISRTVKLTP